MISTNLSNHVYLTMQFYHRSLCKLGVLSIEEKQIKNYPLFLHIHVHEYFNIIFQVIKTFYPIKIILRFN